MIVAGVVLLVLGLIGVIVGLLVAGLDPLVWVGVGVDVVGAVLIMATLGGRRRTL
jgi:hydrogenase-4 membrane subunit HyfE